MPPMTHVITRFPPSPTGRFHMGSARTALFNYLFAKHHGGIMRLRMEDTDLERSDTAHEVDIVDGLKALGIMWDGEVWRQSERTDVYKKYLHQLIEQGHAYEAEESKDGTGKTIRFRNPNKIITFTDEIRGDITFDTTDLGDMVIARTINTPLYHLTVVVDDADMGVTHVIRGEDGISNTPRQILLQEALGFVRPVYAHLPLLLAPDKTKLSKRHGAKPVLELLHEGYLPEAIVNFLALLGWSPGNDQQLFSLQELIDVFSLEGVQKGGAIYNEEKMLWYNREHLKHVSDDVFFEKFFAHVPDTFAANARQHAERFKKLLPDLRERISVWSEATQLAKAGEWAWVLDAPVPNTELLPGKKSDPETAKKHLKWLKNALQEVSEAQWDPDTIKNTTWDYATENGRGQVLWPMRFCLTGKEKSPDPFMVAYALGKTTTLARIDAAIDAL